jgi:hypothetical protein
MRLRKDLVIPAGTIFGQAPWRTVRNEEHVQASLGLTKNTSGDVIYYIGDDKEALAEWFEELV